MEFTVLQLSHDGDHAWAVLIAACDLKTADDPFVTSVVQAVRDAYGESQLRESISPDSAVAARFNLTKIVTAFRSGLPNPAAEGAKPEQLTNSRSETVEVIGREALRVAHDVAFHSHPQLGKTN